MIYRCNKCGLTTRDAGFASRHEGVRRGHQMIPEEDT
jgi:hypothetical protein